MGVMSANGTWLLCFGTQDIVGGVTEARFSSASRRSVDRYLSALTDVSRVPGLTGKEFRRVLLQTEVMRIAAVNEGRIPGSVSGARVTVGRGYDIATDRKEECVRDFFFFCADRWACGVAECPPDVQCHSNQLGLLETVGYSRG
jgi:hypothetical protein